MMDFNYSGWDQFDWEKELRREDARIHVYLNELPRFIDLPEEDELVLKRMRLNPELIAKDADWANIPYATVFDDEDFDDEGYYSDEWRKRWGADIFIAARKMATQCAELFAERQDSDLFSESMRILCFFGVLMARSSDMVDLDEQEHLPLKVALGKRVVDQVNKLMGELKFLSQKRPEFNEKLQTHISQLQEIREKLVDQLFQSKKN